ncbi:HAD-IIA family hydrolase [Mycolicibacterium sp. YH-1]|nr:HAD-IIA family hydrolase [Mycolicibacterium sp. YH-1]UNB56133.1 HAD-IIA family hydrolase [Mycolicibacterium sp. YH-1]
MGCLAAEHDCILLDLDGTVYRGAEPVEGAVATLAEIGVRTLFVTNNAARSPGQVAERMRQMGFSLGDDDVVTSAQIAARLLASRLSVGTPVLIVGTDALAAEVDSVGLRAVRSAAEGAAAVVQGHSPRTGWTDLAEAALTIRRGALWVATNVDHTLPTERGLLPGNGSLVAALHAATGLEPEVAGKPQPAILRDAIARGPFDSPLVVGDRLDTDIASAHAAGLPSLLVCSGVGTVRDLLAAPAEHRPTYVAPDIRGLTYPAARTRVCQQPHWRVNVVGGTATVTSTGIPVECDGLSIVRAAAHAVWQVTPSGRTPVVIAGDDSARAALEAVDLGGLAAAAQPRL